MKSFSTKGTVMTRSIGRIVPDRAGPATGPDRLQRPAQLIAGVRVLLRRRPGSNPDRLQIRRKLSGMLAQPHRPRSPATRPARATPIGRPTANPTEDAPVR